MPTKDDEQSALIKASVQAILDVERELVDYENTLMAQPEFKTFIERQRTAQKQIAETWEAVKEQMIANNIKSLKGDFGSITIAERTSFEIDEDVLDDQYFKKVPDTKRIGDYYKLTNEPLEGTTPRVTQYLTKRIK